MCPALVMQPNFEGSWKDTLAQRLHTALYAEHDGNEITFGKPPNCTEFSAATRKVASCDSELFCCEHQTELAQARANTMTTPRL